MGYTNMKGDHVEALGGGFRFCELSEPLFDASGHIRQSVTFSELARHVYFTETGEPLPRERVSKSPLLGIHHGRAIYLLYNGILNDRSVDGGNVLTTGTLAFLPAHPGPKVVYANGCRFSPPRLACEGLVFKQLPYQLKVANV
jgi:adenine-specific DNA-methyltransferase